MVKFNPKLIGAISVSPFVFLCEPCRAFHVFQRRSGVPVGRLPATSADYAFEVESKHIAFTESGHVSPYSGRVATLVKEEVEQTEEEIASVDGSVNDYQVEFMTDDELKLKVVSPQPGVLNFSGMLNPPSTEDSGAETTVHMEAVQKTKSDADAALDALEAGIAEATIAIEEAIALGADDMDLAAASEKVSMSAEKSTTYDDDMPIKKSQYESLTTEELRFAMESVSVHCEQLKSQIDILKTELEETNRLFGEQMRAMKEHIEHLEGLRKHEESILLEKIADKERQIARLEKQRGSLRSIAVAALAIVKRRVLLILD